MCALEGGVNKLGVLMERQLKKSVNLKSPSCCKQGDCYPLITPKIESLFSEKTELQSSRVMDAGHNWEQREGAELQRGS